MDYRGQVLNEYIYMLIFIVVGAVGFGAGFVAQDFSVTFYGWAFSLALATVVCVPDWKVYNKHPIAWTGKASVVTQTFTETQALDQGDNSRANSDKTQAQARARMAAQRRSKK